MKFALLYGISLFDISFEVESQLKNTRIFTFLATVSFAQGART